MRMKTSPLWRFALCLALLGLGLELGLQPGTARAGGYGGYLEGDLTFAKLKDGDLHRDFDAMMGGLGLLYDGNIAGNELLNYRLAFGYRLGRRIIDGQRNETVNGLTFDQTLGFGLLRNSRIRIWGGPALRIDVDWYSSSGDRDIVDVSIGVGPRVGINYHLNDRISLTTSVAYHLMYLSENIESNGANETFDGPQHIVGLRVGVLWRGEDDLWK